MEDKYLMAVVDDKYVLKGFLTGDSLRDIRIKAKHNNLKLYGKLLLTNHIGIK